MAGMPRFVIFYTILAIFDALSYISNIIISSCCRRGSKITFGRSYVKI